MKKYFFLFLPDARWVLSGCTVAQKQNAGIESQNEASRHKRSKKHPAVL